MHTLSKRSATKTWKSRMRFASLRAAINSPKKCELSSIDERPIATCVRRSARNLDSPTYRRRATFS
jgi:hypothetical protein